MRSKTWCSQTMSKKKNKMKIAASGATQRWLQQQRFKTLQLLLPGQRKDPATLPGAALRFSTVTFHGMWNATGETT